MDGDDYNFEDFDYEPEELPVNETKNLSKVESKSEKTIEKKETLLKHTSSKVGKTTQEDYGGFEECNDEEIGEVEEVKFDEFLSGRKVSERPRKEMSTREEASEVRSVQKVKASGNSNLFNAGGGINNINKKQTLQEDDHVVYEEKENMKNIVNKKQSIITDNFDDFLGNNNDLHNDDLNLILSSTSNKNNKIQKVNPNFSNNTPINNLPSNSPTVNIHHEDYRSVSSVVNQNNNSRLMTNLNEHSTMNYPKLSGVKGNNSNVMSRMQIAENEYSQIKSEIQNIVNQDLDYNDEDQSRTVEALSKQNLDLIQYLDRMNHIINIVVESSRIPMKNPNFPKKKIRHVQMDSQSGSTVTGNNKLLEVYKKEYSKLEARLKQISDPSYEEKLDENLNELNSLITYYEQENKKLKSYQKQSEVKFERQYKNNVVSNVELKKINMDYDNIKKLNELVLEKVQKNQAQIEDNKNKIQELNDWLSKLEVIARESYGIKDYDVVKEEETTEKKAQEKKQNLRKKMEVLEKVMLTNKKKYEAEISRNEKAILNLERNKRELTNLLREKSIMAYRTQEKVKGVYNQYEDNQILTPDIFMDNSEHLHQIINGNAGNSENNANNVTESSRTKEKIIVIDDTAAIEKKQPDQSINNNSNGKLNQTNNNSIINNNQNNSVLVENKKSSGEITKKDILKELDKKSTLENERKLEEHSNNISMVNNSTIAGNLNNSNISPLSNNQTQLIQPGTKFKPNFKFGNTNNSGTNTNIAMNSNVNNNKVQHVIDNNENLNFHMNKNEIAEEIIQVGEEENKIDKINSIRNNPQTITQNNNNQNIFVNNEVKKSNTVNSLNEIPEINDEETIFNSRRQKNQNNKSVTGIDGISTIKEREKTEIKLDATEIKEKDASFVNNRSINTYNTREEKKNVPLFLQDYHNNPEDNVSNVLNNSVTQNNINRRPKESNDTKKPVSIFEDAFKDDKEDHHININNNIHNKKPLFLSDSHDFTEKHEVNEVDIKRKEEFENLFKDDFTVKDNNKNSEISDLPSSNLLFSNNSRGNNGGRNRDINTNSNTSNRANDNGSNANKHKNILDELDEIVL